MWRDAWYAATMSEPWQIGPFHLGRNESLLVIGGPCVLEDPSTNDTIAETLRDLCGELGLQYCFKASFDKANRSSITSARGPGLQEGLDELARIRDKFDVPVTTDVHESAQAEVVSPIADILQVPAFLCRQTDLLHACAQTGRPVNVKKGQFMAPQEMEHVINKLTESGGEQIMITERGTFFGYHRLVNDFIGLGDLMDLGVPACFDVTHSTQLPGAGKGVTAGRSERASLLARAAVAAGVSAVFLECHPVPDQARSDSSTVQPLDVLPSLLQSIADIRQVIQRHPST